MPQRPPLWQDQARAAGGEELVAAIEALTEAQTAMAKKQTDLADTQKQMGDDIHAIKRAVTDLATTAFPGGDAEAHREYHELIIRKTEEIRRLRVAIQEKTISALVWSMIAFLGTCVWSYVSTLFKGILH